MVITKTPLRISLAGGGTDRPDFYRQHGGMVVSAAISAYIYLAVNTKFDGRVRASYSITENVETAAELQHDLIRESLSLMGVKRGVEVVSVADVPGNGTGLGSSSAFTVGLIAALDAYQGKLPTERAWRWRRESIADNACWIEIERCNKPIGKQDQYACTYGGLNSIRFHKDGLVTVKPITMELGPLQRLENNLLLFYLGNGHDAAEIHRNNGKVENGSILTELARTTLSCLERGEVDTIGEILHESWMIKRETAGATDGRIDGLYHEAITAGASGGKVAGAGGGGFLLLYVKENRQADVRAALGLQELPFKFDWDGCKVIYAG